MRTIGLQTVLKRCTVCNSSVCLLVNVINCKNKYVMINITVYYELVQRDQQDALFFSYVFILQLYSTYFEWIYRSS